MKMTRPRSRRRRKRRRRKEMKEKKKKEKGDDSDDDDEDDEAKKQKKKEKKEAKKAKKAEKKEKKKKDKDSSDDDDDESGDDGPKDDLVYTDEVIKESIARLRKLTQEAQEKGKPLGSEKFFDEARMIQIQNAYSPRLRMYVALEAFFGDDLLPAGVKEKRAHLKKLATTPAMPIEDICY